MQKTVWFKIHWILGGLFGLLLFVVGVTGATLSYEKEILQMLNSKTYKVSPAQNAEILEMDLIVKRFLQANPNAKVNSFSFENSMRSSVVINIAQKGAKRGKDIYIDPYTAEILPDLKGKAFFMTVFRLHRWLAFEGSFMSVGKHIVAITTISAILLSFSGLFMLLKNIKKDRLKAFVFSTKAKNRAFLSSMHSAVGLWMVLPFLLLSFTGLFWSYDWYRAGYFKLLQTEPTTRSALGSDASLEELKEAKKVFESKMKDSFARATIHFAKRGEAVEIGYLLASRTHDREFNALRVVGSDVVSNEKFRDKPLNEQIARSIFPLHSGEYFGQIGKFIAFIASLSMALFAITGYMLYLKRKRII